MKTKDQNNNRSSGIGTAGPAILAWRTLFLICPLLCLSPSQAVARSLPEHRDPNSISSPTPAGVPGDPNVTKTHGQIPEDQAPTQLTGGNWLIAKTPTTDLTRRIWRDRITVPKNSQPGSHQNDLRQIIERIRAIHFKPPEQPPKPVVVVEPLESTEPNDHAVEPVDHNNTNVHQPRPAQPSPPSGTISKETLKILTQQLQHPEKLKDPFELGEILFNSGHLKEAAVCYRQALDLMDPNQPAYSPKAAWILFQSGNCLRKDDPEKALAAYARLMSEHPGSMWAAMAKARSDLITWYRQNLPQELIKKTKPKPQEDSHPEILALTTKPTAKMEQTEGG